MGDPSTVVLTATVWFLKFLFFSGWHVTKWVAWLACPLWASVFGLGALCGLM
ncbi:MAG: hypothetical protein ACKOEM_08440 [Planctomycetia bacterium]